MSKNRTYKCDERLIEDGWPRERYCVYRFVARDGVKLKMEIKNTANPEAKAILEGKNSRVAISEIRIGRHAQLFVEFEVETDVSEMKRKSLERRISYLSGLEILSSFVISEWEGNRRISRTTIKKSKSGNTMRFAPEVRSESGSKWKKLRPFEVPLR